MSANSQAELKPLKLGETQTGNAVGNPEPSRLSSEGRACVESRRGVCIKCQGAIPLTKYKNAKYCSVRCRNAYIAYRHAVKTEKIKVPGVGSGGNQAAENNHQYKTGIGSYSEKAFKFYGKICNRCSSSKHLVVHHIDENRRNNDLTNLEVLCKRCHQEHHATRDTLGKYTKGCSTL